MLSCSQSASDHEEVLVQLSEHPERNPLLNGGSRPRPNQGNIHQAIDLELLCMEIGRAWNLLVIARIGPIDQGRHRVGIKLVQHASTGDLLHHLTSKEKCGI